MSLVNWQRFENQEVDGKFHLKKVIGYGGSGGVFRADEVVGDRLIGDIALKLIPVRQDSGDRQYDELVAMRRLSHPNLVGAHAIGECDLLGERFCYVVMHLAESTLQERIAQGRLPTEEAMEVCRNIADALNFLHAGGQVHRDLKPGNLLRISGRWQLADFGLVRTLSGASSATLTTNITGTFCYMPPEGFNGQVSTAWDMWSFGVLIVEMLTGRRPFDGATAEVIRAIVVDGPVIRSPLPEPFHQIVEGCLVRDRGIRWSAQRVLDALSGQIGTASRVSNARHIRPTSRMSSARYILLAIFVCLVIVLSVAVFAHLNPTANRSAPEPKTHTSQPAVSPNAVASTQQSAVATDFLNQAGGIIGPAKDKKIQGKLSENEREQAYSSVQSLAQNGLVAAKRAESLDGSNQGAVYQHVLALYYLNRFAEAKAHNDAGLARFPENSYLLTMRKLIDAKLLYGSAPQTRQ